jgi:hypothetical protein
MIDFQYARADDIADALQLIANESGAKFVAGGTNLIDLMKMEVERPTKVIDINRLPLSQIESTPSGGYGSAYWCETATSPITRWSSDVIPCSRALSWRVRPSSCATWPRPAATCFSVRAAPTFTTR